MGGNKEKKPEQVQQQYYEQAFFQFIIDFLDCLVVALNPEGKIMYCNQLCEKITGLTVSEIKNRCYWDVFCLEEEQDLYQAFFNKLSPAQFPLEVQSQFQDKNGSVVNLLWKYSALPAHGNDFECFVLTGTEITVYEKAKTELQEISEKYRAIIHASPVAVISLDIDTRVRSWSAAAEQLFGWPEKEAIDKKIAVILDEQEGAIGEHCNEVLIGKIINNLEISCTCKDSSAVYINLSLAPLRNYQGMIDGIVLVAFDITARKDAEHAIRKYTSELELKGLELENLYSQLDNEVDQARQIHERTLLANIPMVKGLSLAAHYQPAIRLGGDFYNIIEKGDKLVLYFSDVCGHGMEGIILSTFVKEAIESYVSLKPDEIHPSKILQHLSKQYRRENYPHDYFICIFLAVIDLPSMEMIYSGAGFHEPPLAKRCSGERFRLDSAGPPISAVIAEELLDFKENSFTIDPGTTIMFTTDGLMEQMAGGVRYGSRLEELFYKHSHLPPAVVINIINEDFSSFNNNLLQGSDDITFGIMQRDPEIRLKHELELNSSFAELVRLRLEVKPFISGLDAGELFLSGLHEVVSNAIEHGNNFDPAKKVSVCFYITATYLYAHIKDQGDGFNWREIIDRPMELDGDRERGRGIALTRSYCDQLFYNKKGNEAMMSLVIPEK